MRKHKQSEENKQSVHKDVYKYHIYSVIKEPYSSGFGQPLTAHNTDLTDKSALNHMSLEDNTHRPRQHQDKTRQLMADIQTEKAACKLVEMRQQVSLIQNLFSSHPDLYFSTD